MNSYEWRNCNWKTKKTTTITTITTTTTTTTSYTHFKASLVVTKQYAVKKYVEPPSLSQRTPYFSLLIEILMKRLLKKEAEQS